MNHRAQALALIGYPFPPHRGGCEVCAESIPKLGRKCADHRAADVLARGGKLVDCVRYYPNGDRKIENRVHDDVETWISYNREFRWGNSLFVKGKCIQRGAGFSDKDCADIERALRTGRTWEPRWKRVSGRGRS